MKDKSVGNNRTGAEHARLASAEMARYAKAAPVPPGDDGELEAARIDEAEAAGAVGSVPPPHTMKSAARQVKRAVKGKHSITLMDKLGERLAFERSGARLYQALLGKLEAAEDDFGVEREQVEQIRDEELVHFALLDKAIRLAGGDPTAVTPAADLAGVEASGLVQVLTDPRTSFEQCLHAMLVAELVDREAWVELIELSDALGETAQTERFRDALREEEEHLAHLRRWCAEALGELADVELFRARPELGAPA